MKDRAAADEVRWRMAERLTRELATVHQRYRDILTRPNLVDPDEHRKLTAAHEEAKKVRPTLNPTLTPPPAGQLTWE
jgi:nucleotidyltransferase/DNA polymerase involved in DNA repair